jgi:hypothetical protein
MNLHNSISFLFTYFSSSTHYWRDDMSMLEGEHNLCRLILSHTHMALASTFMSTKVGDDNVVIHVRTAPASGR